MTKEKQRMFAGGQAVSNHIGNANKMVSDTPRTDDAYFNAGATMYDLAGEMKRMERELNSANDRIKRLEDWKQSALAVEREWNANAIATMLGGKLGESQREVIQREVPKLLARIKRLEEAGDAMEQWASEYGPIYRWRKAKEAKP